MAQRQIIHCWILEGCFLTQHYVWEVQIEVNHSNLAQSCLLGDTKKSKNSSKGEETFGPMNVNHSYLLLKVSLISHTCLWMPQLDSNSWSSDCCPYTSPIWTTMWRWMFCSPLWYRYKCLNETKSQKLLFRAALGSLLLQDSEVGM